MNFFKGLFERVKKALPRSEEITIRESFGRSWAMVLSAAMRASGRGYMKRRGLTWAQRIRVLVGLKDPLAINQYEGFLDRKRQRGLPRFGVIR